MDARVIEHAVFPGAQTQEPEGPALYALAQLPGEEKGVSHREPPDTVAGEPGEKGDALGHHVKAQRHHQSFADLQGLLPEARVCQADGLHRGPVLPGQRPEGVAPLKLVHQITGVPGRQRPVGLPPGHAVGVQPRLPLEAPQRSLRFDAENAVRLQLPGSRPVQGQLQQRHRRTLAAHAQHSHPCPSLFRVFSEKSMRKTHAACLLSRKPWQNAQKTQGLFVRFSVFPVPPCLRRYFLL